VERLYVALGGADLRTRPIALAVLSGEYVQDTELMMAGSVLTVLPVLVHFVAVQRYYVARITAGSLKE
jgi:multiple sugar transport system permease protein